MRIKRQTEQELVVEDSGMWISATLFLCSLPLFYLATKHGKTGSIFGGSFFLLCALLLLRRTVFSFNTMDQMVHWKGRVLLKVSSGSIPFSEIKGIGTETTSGSNGATTYRLTILTADGAIPLASSYEGNLNRYLSMREAILRFLRLDESEATSVLESAADSAIVDEASVRSLLRQGRKIDAISLVKSTEKISLTEAVDRVEQIDRVKKAAQ